MSCDPEWLFLGVPPARFEAITARFARAAERSRPGEETLALLERWRRDPEGPVADGALRVFDPFVAEGFKRLACELVDELEAGSGGDASEVLLLERVLLNRIPPTLALWVGLGPARADRLPGHFGNLLVPPGEVARVLEEVRAILDLPADEYFARALRALEWGNNGRAPAEAEALRAVLPSALERARAEGCGLLGLCVDELVPPWWRRDNPPLLSAQVPPRERRAPGGEAAKLRKDVASGLLPRASVEVAALLEHPAALAALERSAPEERADVARQVYLLSDWGNEPYYRGLLGVAQALLAAHSGPVVLDPETERYLRHLGRRQGVPADGPPLDLGAALGAAIECVRRPGPSARQAAKLATQSAAAVDWVLPTLEPRTPDAALVVVAQVARTACWYDPEEERMANGHEDVVRHAVRALGEEAVRKAVADAVVPWALGYEDPLGPKPTPHASASEGPTPRAVRRAKPKTATKTRKSPAATKSGTKPPVSGKSKAKPRGRKR